MSDPIEARLTETRSELEQTLDAIQDRLNVRKQLGKYAANAKASYKSQPVPWIVGATAAAIVIGGLAAWAIFGDD
jgi:chorismate mutase